MNRPINYPSETDEELIKDILSFIDNRSYDQAIQKIRLRLQSLSSCQTKEDCYLKIELAGFLIDIGEEGKIKQAALDGLEIMEAEKDGAKGVILESSMEYNLGNAYSTLFKIRTSEPGFEYVPNNIDYLMQSKNHYWKSFKADFQLSSEFGSRAIVNLANALSLCGRVVESLQYYDLVLEKNPDFPNANASRAKELMWLNELSGVWTQNLIHQAKSGYEKASRSVDVPTWLKDLWEKKAIELTNILAEIGFDKINLDHEIEETKKEYESLTNYRRFCIDSRLTLSEHSLYCNCIGSRRDDLLICIPFRAFDSHFIPMMEKTLNRLKSEYSLARLMYFYSITDSENEFTAYDSEVMFTELFDSEYIGTKSELLRTSFRLCFGILDKIASAVCFMFDLADEKEPIYFESFWNPQKKNASKKKRTRWDKINAINNISLLALYTQASDLNLKTGEWGFFKSWRNSLEHNQLCLLNNEEVSPDIFDIYKDNVYLSVEGRDYFQSKTLQILHFTRSAIFNFVFLVRNEAMKSKPKEGKYIKHTFSFKNDHEI